MVIPSDDAFRLRGAPVAEAVARDRAAGSSRSRSRPSPARRTRAPSTRIGELADVAAAEDLWLHVDAAYGGAARLSARDAGRVPDLDRADSVTVDPAQVVLPGLRHRRAGGPRRPAPRRSRSAAARPEYYRGGETPDAAPPTRRRAHDGHGSGDQLNFYKLGFEGTRRWRALKLWMSWKHLGTEGFGRLIEANDDLAAHLARRCAEADDFEALPEVPELSVVCFRHLPGGRGRDGDAPASSMPTRTASRPRSSARATAG